MKKWKRILLISLIVFIVSAICSLTFNNIKVIWELCRILLYTSIAGFICSIIGCIVIAISKKEKLPIWVDVIIALIITMIVIFILGNLSKNEFDTKAKEYQEQNKNLLLK